LTRLLWSVLAGAWGAWIGFQGIFGPLPHLNADTAAPLFVWLTYGLFGLVGLIVGATLGAVIGRSADWLLRRLGVGTGTALVVASLLTALVIREVTAFVQHRYPGLRAPTVTQDPRAVTPSTGPSDAARRQNPCEASPPTDARERAAWDLECR
jgi:hypothetical protein